FIFSIFLSCSFDASAQYRNKSRSHTSNMQERGVVVVVGAGIAAIKSDICGSWGCNNFGPSASVGALYKLTPYLGFSGNIDYMRLGATEKVPNPDLNIAFESEVLQFSGSIVLNLLDSYAGAGNYRSSRKRFVVPYVRAGIGAVYYTATSFPRQYGELDDSQTTYDPEREYPAFAAVIPFGGGLRFRVNDEFSIAPELMYQITSTDFLDNIGPRIGDPNTKDHFGVASIKLQYTPVIKNKIFSKKR
ncbi:outer membrane beta-barrel protein, partial [Pontibacter rugosus]